MIQYHLIRYCNTYNIELTIPMNNSFQICVTHRVIEPMLRNTNSVLLLGHFIFYLGIFLRLLVVLQRIVIIWFLPFDTVRPSGLHDSTVGTRWALDGIATCIEKRVPARTGFAGNRYLVTKNKAIKFINISANAQNIVSQKEIN